MLPPFTDAGNLPPGLHDATLEEVQARFGSFQKNDQRPRLWMRFIQFFLETQASRIIKELLLDGSFVSSKLDPNDIDVIIVLSANHDFAADLPPSQYNLCSARRVQRRFGLDTVVVKQNSSALSLAVKFFSQVRNQPGSTKGLVRLIL